MLTERELALIEHLRSKNDSGRDTKILDYVLLRAKEPQSNCGLTAVGPTWMIGSSGLSGSGLGIQPIAAGTGLPLRAGSGLTAARELSRATRRSVMTTVRLASSVMWEAVPNC